MIDVEGYVFTPIAEAVRAEFSGAYVTGEYVNEPARFPHVTIVESDNYTSTRHLDNADSEKFATVMYQVDVYSNKTQGKKKECKDILKLIDSMMYARNFTRISASPVPNLFDGSIYRLTARYRAETDGEAFYRTI